MSARPLFMALILCFVTAAAGAADAPRDHYDTGYDLFSSCTSHHNTDYGYCAGYVTAVADMMLQNEVYGFRACNHAPVRSQQLVDLVTLFLEDNKGLQERPAKLVIAMALARAFPCL